VTAAMSFLELGGDECDNLVFRNFKINSYKIRKSSWILRNFNIRKIRIHNLCLQAVTSTATYSFQLGGHRACMSVMLVVVVHPYKVYQV